MRPFRLLPVVARSAVILDVSAAKRELNIAWEQYKQSTIRHYKDGLGFGRVCYEWRAKYKAQGSRGKGFDHILEQVRIPKTTAYRWIRRYEVRYALRAKRNEVEDKHLKPDGDPPSNIRDRETRTSFYFFLTEGQRDQFEEDIKILGGHKRVTEMFLDFVSRNAFEKRGVNAANEKTEKTASFYYEDIRRTA